MFYLDFLWRTRLSIWSNEGPRWGPWGPLWAINQSKHASNHQVFLCLPSMGLTPSFPIHKSSHSTIFYLDFSWNMWSSIWDHLGPWGWLLGPLQARQQPKHASNHQIFFCPPSMGLTPNFPTVRSTHSKLLYLDFSWKGRSSIWNYWGPWGGQWGPLQARKRPKHASKHPIFFCPPSMGLTANFPSVRLSHSKLLYLDFSWYTWSSIWNHWGPHGGP